ncbi:hypothetical protein BpHYR1_039714 [Brachionus plicatilis]|uniref:Uncharacterized protein n=1 Tax=Brachionus plicatilis TaxID=10195 RepID=A0A3M7T674_BRAPC|nr:hypothetical protein BpHYR1_039714 [Brachionus plicatilis]
MSLVIFFWFTFNIIVCSPVSKNISLNDQKNASVNASLNGFIIAELDYLSSQANKTVQMPIDEPLNKSGQQLSQNHTQIKLSSLLNLLSTTKDNKIIEYKLPVIQIGKFWSMKPSLTDFSYESQSDYFSNEYDPWSSYDHDEKFNRYYMKTRYLVGDLVKNFNLNAQEIYRLINQYAFYDSSIEQDDYSAEDLGSILGKLVQAQNDFDYISNYGSIDSNRKLKENFVKFYENVVSKKFNKLKILTRKIKDVLFYGY